MADYQAAYPDFKVAGVEVAALSVDPPERASAMRRDLGLEFPILCDSSRATITEWGLLNTREHGGIARPATFVIDPGRMVRFSSAEEVISRVSPADMLAFLRANPATAAAPRTRSVIPGMMFLRAAANAFRHGVRVRN